MITKLLIVETAYITLYQYPIYHKYQPNNASPVITKLLIVETASITEFLPNIPSITKSHPNHPSHVIIFFWLLRLLPSLNPYPIYYISQIPIPIFHPLWSLNLWLLILLLSPLPNTPSTKKTQPNLPSPVTTKLIIVGTNSINLDQSPIYHKIPSQSSIPRDKKRLLLRLIISPLTNLLPITNCHTNLPSPMITKLMIVNTASITLDQSTIHQKFRSQSTIPYDNKIADFWDCFLVWEYGRRRITSLLTEDIPRTRFSKNKDDDYKNEVASELS